MAEDLPKPASRKEEYLAKAAGMDVDELPEPASREEQYLNAIAEGGGGGGTSNFNQLSNRPKYNNTTMTGETNIPEVKTYSDFTGTDGTSAGAAGLVPAPATTDAGKFLKADGTWATAGGGGPTVVQTTGASQTDVMSQDATTSMIFSDPSTKYKVNIGDGNTIHNGNTNGVVIGRNAQIQSTAEDCVRIGTNGLCYGSNGVSIGYNAQTGAGGSYGEVAIGYNAVARSYYGISIGYNADSDQNRLGCVNLGAYSKSTRQGEVNVGAGTSGIGYNNTNYRVIGGVHDAVDAHDAVPLGQLNTRMGGMTILTITQAAYDVLATKDPNTLYVITGA